MAAPAQHDFGEVVQGNTWLGIYPAMIITVNNAAPTSALASVRMQFRRTPGDPAAETLSSEDDEITINDASTWNITIPPQVLELCAGDWMTDIEFTNAAGEKKTYVAGKLKVLPAITREPYENG